MNILYKATLSLTFTFGILLSLMSFGLIAFSSTASADAVLADRWYFFIIEEGVEDEEVAYRIAERLAADNPDEEDPLMMVTLISGMLLTLSSAWSFSRRPKSPTAPAPTTPPTSET